MTYKHMVAEIISCERQVDFLRTVLTLDRFFSLPLAPASLYSYDEKLVKVLDVHKLAQRVDKVLTFETYDKSSANLTIGKTYNFICWWDRSQLEIVRNTSRLWRKQLFTPKDMLRFETDNGQVDRKMSDGEIIDEGTIVKDGWDHEHCVLCGDHISDFADDFNDGYTDGRNWLCVPCYQAYIASGFGKKLGEQ